MPSAAVLRWCPYLCSESYSLLWEASGREVTGHICHSPLQQVLAHFLLYRPAG